MRWNRTCALAAWMVLMWSAIVPKLGKGHDWRNECASVSALLGGRYAPPGYRPPPGKDKE